MKFIKLNGKSIVFFVIGLFLVNFVNADPLNFNLQKIGEGQIDLFNDPPGSCTCNLDGYGQYTHCDPGINNCFSGYEQTCVEIKDSNNIVIDCGCNCIGPDPECTPGQTRECGYSNVGICELGIEECLNNGQWSGNCEGAIYPQEEVCENNIDENCDGVDNGCLSVEYYYNGDCGKDPDLINSWGRLCKVKDFSGSTELEYDDRGNIIKHIVNIDGYQDSFVIEYEYDSNNNLIKEILLNDGVIEYVYNNLNQIQKIKYNGVDVDFYYDTNGLVGEIEYENSVDTDYEYDFRDRVKEIDVDSESEELLNKEYEYDSVGNLRFLYEDGDLLAEYIYDNLYRLINVDDNDYYGFNLLTFQYDKSGNRLNKNEDSNIVTYNYEPLSNRLLSINQNPVMNLEYDSSGNLVKINGVKKYNYNIDNMLTIVFDDNEAIDEQYLYNYKNQRVKKIKGTIPSDPLMNGITEITYYVYDIKGNMVYSLYKTINNEVIKAPVGGSVAEPELGDSG